MTGLLENHKEAIVGLCRKYSDQRLFAFGSVIRDDFRPGESDVDLLVKIYSDWWSSQIPCLCRDV